MLAPDFIFIHDDGQQLFFSSIELFEYVEILAKILMLNDTKAIVKEAEVCNKDVSECIFSRWDILS